MKVSFELSPRDMTYFRERLKVVRNSVDREDEGPILEGAEQMMADARASDPPEFVLERLKKLEGLLEMLRDSEWRLEGRDRARILDALAYFADPEDMIPDRLPGIGYLDDAIMVELMVQDLRHEISAYEDFRAFRAQGGKASDDKLEAKRESLQSRMRRRRRRDREELRSRSGKSKRSPLGLW